MANHTDNISWMAFLEGDTITTPVVTNVSSFYIENGVDAKSMKQQIEHYCFPLVCIFGLIGNTLAVIVFLRKELRMTSCNLYLAARSVSDNGFLFILLLIWISKILHVNIMMVNVLCHICIFFTYFCGSVSVWLVVMVTIENYIRICHPFKVTQFCTNMKAKFIIGAFCVGALALYHLPLWIVTTNCTPKPEFAQVTQALVLTDSLLTLVVPTCLISGFTLTIMYSLIKSLHTKKKQKSCICRRRRTKNGAHCKVTKMLFALTVIFFTLNFPSHVIRARILINTYMKGIDISPALENVFQSVFQLLYYLSFSINILIYLIFGGNFRSCFINLFCKRRRLDERENLGCVHFSISQRKASCTALNDQTITTKLMSNDINENQALL